MTQAVNERLRMLLSTWGIGEVRKNITLCCFAISEKEVFMLSRKYSVTLSLFILCASAGYAQTPSSTPQRETGFLRRIVTLRLTTIDYRVYIPADYDPSKNIRSFFIFMGEAQGVMTMKSKSAELIWAASFSFLI